MQIHIEQASMERTEDKRFVGKVYVRVEGHKQPYEIIVDSKNMKDWGYALYFQRDSGPEEEIDALDAYIDEHEDVFERIVQAAKDAYQEGKERD
ncbi:hypothetical protein DUZ99_15845 [Xylanibacillus composti]|uniref:Uncharacterized protein n=2 Tax=Xylanibacillus composti TaxID=1572762 RepID=A0A8J4H7U9_9BACL|nr:hypothetical protein [Xylanibacillus composti]MDT9726455.1 hypothetical protein [Xylanibacillus composti]GIQ71386.1 hypothetical protein XYCOK13_42100 [Xylanibacillus composti]